MQIGDTAMMTAQQDRALSDLIERLADAREEMSPSAFEDHPELGRWGEEIAATINEALAFLTALRDAGDRARVS